MTDSNATATTEAKAQAQIDAIDGRIARHKWARDYHMRQVRSLMRKRQAVMSEQLGHLGIEVIYEETDDAQ